MGKIMPLGTGDIPCSDLTHLGGDKRWGRCPCLSPGFEGSRGRTRVFFSYTPVPKVHFSLSFHVVMLLREDTVLPDPSPRSHGADTDPECSPGASTSPPLNGQAGATQQPECASTWKRPWAHGILTTSTLFLLAPCRVAGRRPFAVCLAWL